MRRVVMCAISVFSWFCSVSFVKAINLDIAEVQSGTALLQGGGATANATISWQGRTVATANNIGRFTFSGVIPSNCIGTLSDGVSTIHVLVLDCTPAVSKTPNRIVNGGFETGDLTGWSTIGDVSVQTLSFGDTPPQGNFQVLLTNAPLFGALVCVGDPPVCGPINPDMPLSFSGNNGLAGGLCDLFDAPFNSSLCNGLGIAGFFDQSGIKQTFTTKSPGVLMFKWAFLSDEIFFGNLFLDGRVFVLDDKVFSLSPGVEPSIDGQLPSISSSATVFLSEIGYQAAIVPISAGTHTFGFGIGDVGDPLIASGLLIDDIVFIPGNQGARTN